MAVVEEAFCEPVLSFVKAFRLRGDASSLKQAALSRFSASLLFNAKKALWDHCASELAALELSLPSRRSSERRSQAAADLDDILNAFDKLDDADKLPKIYCEADDLIKLPPVAADPVSELVLGNSACLSSIDDKVTQLQSALTNLTSKVEASLSSSCSFADAVRSTDSSGSHSPPVSPPPRPKLPAQNRSGNIIMFGLPESNSLGDLRKSVDEVLSFLTGTEVPLNDLYRLGRLRKSSDSSSSASPPRPVIVTFASAWDRRLVLSSVRQLKGYGIKGIFIREDLSPEELQKRKEQYRSRSSQGNSNGSPPAPAAEDVQSQSQGSSVSTSGSLPPK